MKKIGNRGKAVIGVVAFLLITPLIVFYALEETGVFDIRSEATEELTDDQKKADLDSNGKIEIADFSIWLSNWRQFKSNPDAYTTMSDLDGDDVVAISDFVLWLQLWREYKNPSDNGGGDNGGEDPVIVESTDFGTGADGDASLSGGTVNINESSLVGRSCADAVSYSILSFESSKIAVLGEGVEGCISAGDEVLIINLSGTTDSTANVGNYESLMVEDVSGDRVTFTTAKTKRYGDGTTDNDIGISTGNQKVILQRIPQYEDVDVDGTLTVNAWNGVSGGVLFFRAKGTVTVTGTISVEGKGYRGGDGSASSSQNALPGEGTFTKSGDYGKGGAYHEQGNTGLWSGGGGAGGYSISLTGGDGTTRIGAIGGGGGGSTSSGHDYQNSEKGYGGGGGGGGHVSGGEGGTTKYGTTGSSGTGSTSGKGSNGTKKNKFHDSPSYYSIYVAGGGGGGKSIGSTTLSQIFFGGGGGGGGAGRSHSSGYSGTDGGSGGGIIILGCYELVVSSGGYISANGEDTEYPSSGLAGAGGSGAGGSIKLIAGTLTLGSGQVTANAGTAQGYGGDGSNGRIYIRYSSYTGSTSPTATTVKMSE